MTKEHEHEHHHQHPHESHGHRPPTFPIKCVNVFKKLQKEIKELSCRIEECCGGGGTQEYSQLLHVREMMASGEVPATPVAIGDQVRALNIQTWNDIPGAKLNSDHSVTLPIGTYDIVGKAQGMMIDRQRALIKNTSGQVLFVGESSSSSDAINYAEVRCRLKITAETTIQLIHWIEVIRVPSPLGSASNDGLPEYYSELLIKKVG